MPSVEIVSALILRNQHSADTVYLKTTWPDATHPSKENATVTLSVPKGGAEEFLAKHLPGVPVETVTTSSM